MVKLVRAGAVVDIELHSGRIDSDAGGAQVMDEITRLASEVARAALGAELEYIRWTREYGTIDMGCEHLISTAIGRAASAYYGLNNDITVFLEEPIKDIARYSGWKEKPPSGRIDCAIYKGKYPFAVIECKRLFATSNLQNDVARCIKLLEAKPRKLECAFLVALRSIKEGDKQDREALVEKVRSGFAAQHGGYKIGVVTAKQSLMMPVCYEDDDGIERVWTAALAACLTIVRQ